MVFKQIVSDETILKTLKFHNGNKIKACQALNINRTSLDYRLKRMGWTPPIDFNLQRLMDSV